MKKESKKIVKVRGTKKLRGVICCDVRCCD